jgi:hypothetical protein
MLDASFLTNKVSAFGLVFQNWMLLVAIALALYALFGYWRRPSR